jgi:hypothetical protein
MTETLKIQAILTRDSVCAGDDVDAPHEERVELVAHTGPVEFLEQFSAGYVASVNGLGHSWTAYLNGTAIAVFRVNGIEPLVSALSFADDNTIFFEYHSARY